MHCVDAELAWKTSGPRAHPFHDALLPIEIQQSAAQSEDRFTA